MNKITIIHDYPISYFPPTMNMVNVLEDRMDVEVITTAPDKGILYYSPRKARMHIPVHNKKTDSTIMRLLKSVWFYLSCFWRLCITKPDAILYYESISALPVYYYKRYINRKVKVMIHYHEYMTPKEYDRPGMRLHKFCLGKEVGYLFDHAEWISQTNYKRVELFRQDYPNIRESFCHILPNYPPKSWWRKEKTHSGGATKCVYIGSLSSSTTYVREFCEWVKNQNGKVTFDIYCFNFHQEIKDYLLQLDCKWIQFYEEGVAYDNIPNVLDKYDVGLLLYKANSLNFQWNETNKFYEYLICGLDVWYPKEMLLLHAMNKRKFAPKIIEVDFKDINIEIENTSRRIDNTSNFCFADEVYNDFYKYINQ